MANAYATDWTYCSKSDVDCNDVHVFGSRSERDEWTAADPYREPVRASIARSRAMREEICYLHDGARLPKSWDTDRCWWDQGQCSATLQDFRR